MKKDFFCLTLRWIFSNQRPDFLEQLTELRRIVRLERFQCAECQNVNNVKH